MQVLHEYQCQCLVPNLTYREMCSKFDYNEAFIVFINMKKKVQTLSTYSFVSNGKLTQISFGCTLLFNRPNVIFNLSLCSVPILSRSIVLEI